MSARDTADASSSSGEEGSDVEVGPAAVAAVAEAEEQENNVTSPKIEEAAEGNASEAQESGDTESKEEEDGEQDAGKVDGPEEGRSSSSSSEGSTSSASDDDSDGLVETGETGRTTTGVDMAVLEIEDDESRHQWKMEEEVRNKNIMCKIIIVLLLLIFGLGALVVVASLGGKDNAVADEDVSSSALGDSPSIAPTSVPSFAPCDVGSSGCACTGGAGCDPGLACSPATNICSTLATSGNPTSAPSIAPSSQPTATFSPSLSPSATPTASPSSQPTATFSPSLSPSATPTASPSMAPTSSPSAAPTANPSTTTTSPTITPTASPTANPSAAPSFAPSPSPTSSPSPSPSSSPTSSPSNDPTGVAVPYVNSFAGIDSSSSNDLRPVAAAVSEQRVVSVWYGKYDLGGAIGALDNDIFYAISNDNGATWGDAGVLNSDATTDNSDNDIFPDIVYLGNNNGAETLLVAWHGFDLGADGDIFYSLSLDAGQSWQPSKALNSHAASDEAGVDDVNVQLASLGGGVAIAVWNSQYNLNGVIGGDHDIFTARTSDWGVTWSDVEVLNSNSGTVGAATNGNFHPSIATVGAGGVVVVVWHCDEFGDNDIFFSRSADAGVTWSAATVLRDQAVDNGQIDLYPNVAWLGGTTVFVAWQSKISGIENDILYVRSPDGGITWGAAAPLHANAASDEGDDYSVKVEWLGGNNALAVWWSRDELAGTIGSDGDILFCRSTDAGATWGPVGALNTNAFSTSTGSDVVPNPLYLGNDVVLVQWHSDDDLNGTIGTDKDILFSRSVDGGLSWTMNGF